jgi:hypothetical protein
MAYMVIGGIPVRVLTDSANGATVQRGGGVVRAFAGNLRSSLDWGKQEWPRTTGKMTSAEVTTLLGVIGSPAGGNVVSCSGDFSRGTTLDCLVTVESIDDVKQSATEVRYRLHLLVRQV